MQEGLRQVLRSCFLDRIATSLSKNSHSKSPWSVRQVPADELERPPTSPWPIPLTSLVSKPAYFDHGLVSWVYFFVHFFLLFLSPCSTGISAPILLVDLHESSAGLMGGQASVDPPRHKVQRQYCSLFEIKDESILFVDHTHMLLSGHFPLVQWLPLI